MGLKGPHYNLIYTRANKQTQPIPSKCWTIII